MSPSDRRRDERWGLNVPMRVLGHDPDGTPWEEMTTTHTASYGGASFPLKHAHGVGQVLYISSPLPRNFRRYDLAEQSYRIFALVRNTRVVVPGGEHMVGVMFIGKVPPKGYDTKPGGRYRLPDDPRTGPQERQERRRRERMQLFVNLRLRRVGVSGVLEEQTVTENVCRGGARVFTTLPVSTGEKVTVTDLGETASAEAVVRNAYTGTDHVKHLNLEFPDVPSFERLLHAAGAPPLPEGS